MKYKLQKATYIAEDGNHRYEIKTDKTKVYQARHRMSYDTWHGGKCYYYGAWENHKEDGPAVIFPDGTERYYLRHRLHRTDGPASYNKKGIPMYRLKGKKVSVYEILGNTKEALAHALKYEAGGSKI